MSRHFALAAFVALCLAQLYLAGSGIARHERTLRDGSEHRFACAPVDPEDPFRGRYVQLAFETAQVELQLPEHAEGPLYAELARDARGMSVIARLHAQPPQGVDYLRLDGFSSMAVPRTRGGRPWARVQLPFERYFMNEALAPLAEQVYRERLGTRAQPGVATDSYLSVRVRDGHAVAEQLFVDGQPIEALARARHGGER